MKSYPQDLIDKAISNSTCLGDYKENATINYPRISVVVPSFNQGAFLEETILSIINQNYPNLELIICDGGSTDNSVSILKKYQNYIHYWVSEPDNGQVDAIHKGLKKSTGDLIGWLNSDDLYLPESLTKVANSYLLSPTSDLFFGNCFLIDEDSNFIWELKYVPFSLEYLLYCGWNISTQAAFWSREVMERTGEMKNVDVAFDYDWFLRIADNANKVVFIRTGLGCYRMQPNSKYSLVNEEVRMPLYMSFRKTFIPKLNTEVEFEKQFRLKRFYLYARKLFSHIKQKEFSYLFDVIKKRFRFHLM